MIAILAVAVAAGQLVQTRNTGAQRDSALSVPQDVTRVAAGPDFAGMPGLTLSVALPALPGASAAQSEMLRGGTTAGTVRATLPGPETGLPTLVPPPVLAPPEGAPVQACASEVVLRAAPQAMIGLSLRAPCRADERVVIRHAGLAVTAKTDAAGGLSLALPGMERSATVSVLFADGSLLQAGVELPDAETLRRFAVQWQGEDEFALHAFEGGADYGDPGHVWAGAPNLPVSGAGGGGGWMMSLGDVPVGLPLRAAVYTFPTEPGPAPVIVIEAPVVEATCGREMLGELLTAAGGTVEAHDLTLAMPDCSALGDILVLKNLAPAVKIATTN